MNKKFYFALALTAGLFASCSSDDISQAPSLGGQEGNPDGAINLSIANASQGATRGTGTVGSTTAADPQWAGQKVKIYMLKTGTLDQAYELKDDGTEDLTKPLFENQEMVVEQNNAALILDIAADAEDASWKDRTVHSKYFPGSGVYDFWGYRTDGAEKAAPADGATAKTIAFEIDGSQDLMSGKATPLTKDDGSAAAATDYGYWNAGKTKVYGTYGGANVEVDPAKLYSAYSARREIDPVLHFSHRLARFTFQVKGANAGCCIVEGETDPDKIAEAINVTGITVKDAKYKGDLVIAYTGAAAPDPITWDADVKDLALKQRVQKVVTPATGSFYGLKVVRGADDAGGDPTYSYTVATAVAPAAPATPNALKVNGATITDDMEVYDGYGTDANTNLPNDNPTTIAAIKATLAAGAANTESAVYYRYFPTTPVVPSIDPADIDLTADLVALQPVQPIKDAGGTPQKTKVGEALLLPADVNEYKIVLSLRQQLKDTEKTVVDANGHVIYVDDPAGPTTYYLYSAGQAAGAGTPAVHDAAVAYADDATYNAAIAADATASAQTGVATAADAEAAAELLAIGHYYFPNTTAGVGGWFVNVTAGYIAGAAAVAAHYYDKANAATHMTTAAQQIAVADVEAAGSTTYFKWVEKTTTVKNMTVKQTIKLPEDPATGTPMAFTPGKSYNVVITVNGFEEIGGDGTPTQPKVDSYVEYEGGDINLDDNTEE
jgi:hypothetical protein